MHGVTNKFNLSCFSVSYTGRINQGHRIFSLYSCGDTSFIVLHTNTLIKQTFF